MSETAGRITYDEVREPSVLERTLTDRAPSAGRIVALVCLTLSISLALFHLYVAVFGTPETRSFRSTHLTVMLVLAILLNPLWRGRYSTLR